MAATTAIKTVLHVGCGAKHAHKLHQVFQTPEWQEVRLDIDPSVQPDIVGTITDMSIVETASVDAVWSSHNLEHLYSHEVPVALREFHRVIKPGGFALVTMPDLQQVAAFVAQGRLEDVLYQSPAGPISAIDVIYGHRASVEKGNHFMAHKTGFTAQSLGQKLFAAGFPKVQVQCDLTLNLWATARK
jgi:ubiquinone/menaquinone biosynthesis C-methylase UbiE